MSCIQLFTVVHCTQIILPNVFDLTNRSMPLQQLDQRGQRATLFRQPEAAFQKLSLDKPKPLRPFLIGPEHGVHEQLCLLEIFKLADWFLIDVFALGERLCSRPMGTHSDVRNVSSAGYGSKLSDRLNSFVTEEKK